LVSLLVRSPATGTLYTIDFSLPVGATALGVAAAREPAPPSPPPQPVQPWESWDAVRTGWREAEAAIRPPQVKVHGIYMTGYTAGYDPDRLIDLVKRTELNAIVVDIKDDSGHVTYDSHLSQTQAVGAVDTATYMPSLEKFVAKLKAANIYSIARIVTFKDPVLAPKHPEWAAQRQGGGIWRDRTGAAWLNPYSKEAWNYNIAIAKEAARRGFDEIQFDYVRFPSDGDTASLVFPGADQRARAEVIGSFLTYAHKELAPYRVWVSADVFGLVVSEKDDMGIGQQYEQIGPALDYVSPMVYPSHYGPGNLGLPDPDGAPYETVYRAMQDARRRQTAGGWTNLTVRPWLQDFSLGHHYPPEWVRQQIQAVYDSGLDQWLLWNAANVYSEAALQHK